MEPQVSQVSWRAPYRCTRLLILYLSVVKNELLTRRKGYLIIDIVRTPPLKMLTRERFTRDERRTRCDARNLLARFWQIAFLLSLASANVRAFEYLNLWNQMIKSFRHLDICLKFIRKQHFLPSVDLVFNFSFLIHV